MDTTMDKYSKNDILVNTSTGEKFVITEVNADSCLVQHYVSGHEHLIRATDLPQYRHGGCAVTGGNFYVCVESENESEFKVGKTYMSDENDHLIGESGKSVIVTDGCRFRNWKISDAKPGDVLKTYGYIFEVKEISSGEVSASMCIDSYGVSYPDMKFTPYGYVMPATYIEKLRLVKKYNTEKPEPVTVNTDERSWFRKAIDFIKYLFS